MITYGNIYIITKDFIRAVEFYKKLFEKDVTARNKSRYAIFDINGLNLSLLNGRFDEEHQDEVVKIGQNTPIYDDIHHIMECDNCGKVVINLNTDDLLKEHRRVSEEHIGYHITPIRYLNAKCPYWYFLMKDMDGNTIEITGKVPPNYEVGV